MCQLPGSSLPELKAPRFSTQHLPTAPCRSSASRQYLLEGPDSEGCPERVITVPNDLIQWY
jgi:hypothetical protein